MKKEMSKEANCAGLPVEAQLKMAIDLLEHVLDASMRDTRIPEDVKERIYDFLGWGRS